MRTAWLAAACAALWSPALAQEGAFGGGSDEPVELSAEQGCDGDLEGLGPLVCRGNVIVAQGPAILTAETLALTFYPGTQDPKLIEAEGGVRYASGEDAISGLTGVFDGETSTITVTGEVVVVQGEQVVTGERLVYNTQTGAISLSGAPGQRVRGLFVTKRDAGQGGGDEPSASRDRTLRD